MSVWTAVKRASIALGLYRPARSLSRRLRPRQLRALRADTAFYRALLPPDSLCFDVGANVGEKSEALLDAGARVVAFEPNPGVLDELRARCGRRRNWTLVQAALGSRAAIATLYVRTPHGESGLLESWQGRLVDTCRVPVVTLDAAVESFGCPAYCKLDVEGWELEVLRGLTHPIPLVSFEFRLDPADIAKARACLEWLARFGPGTANVTRAENPTFPRPEWIPLERFLATFPADLGWSPFGNAYGEIFVRRESG